MPHSRRDRWTATTLGIFAIVIWASLVAVARGTHDEMGVLPSAAVANLIGGAIGIVVEQARCGYLGRARRLPAKYLLGCGAMFILYNVALFPAIEWSSGEAQVVQVGLIQYLWPALTLAFSLPILHQKASWWFWPGLVVATAGAFLAKAGGSFSWGSFFAGLDTNPWPYLLALVAAVSWGLYSNLARRWASQAGVSGAPIFLLATGAALAVIHIARGGTFRLPTQPRPLAELAYLTIFPTLLAYVFWDVSMRRGQIVLVTSLSFLTPLLSTIITCVYLGVPMATDLLVASGLVIAGAIICKKAIHPTNATG